MKKLNLILDNTNWLEATWVEETESAVIHCESFSGHKEHIAMLRNKALEFGTSLDEYESLISECESKFIYPTKEELAQQELQSKINEANSYLKNTDWVNNYKTRHDLGLDLIPADSSKWIVINKRTEYIKFLKANS